MSITLGPQWTSQGPAPITEAGNVVGPTPATSIDTGAVEAIAVDPMNSSHVYVGTVNGGIWQTQNYTASPPTWTTTTDQMPSLAIMSLAISPMNSNVVYAGTGSLSSAYGDIRTPGEGGTAAGIYKTTNGGQSWSVVGADTFKDMRVAHIVATSLNNGNTIFAATYDTTLHDASFVGGIYRSDDGGNTWTRLSGYVPGLPNTGVTELTYNPANPDQLFTAIPGTLTDARSSAGIYEIDITATGETVTNITGSLASVLSNVKPASGKQPDNLLQTADQIKISVSAASPNPIYVGIVNGSGYLGGVWRGVESAGAVTWSEVGLTAPAVYGTNDQGNLHFALVADPNHNNLVYVGGDTLGYITNGGAYAGNLARGDSTLNHWTGFSDLSIQTTGSGFPQYGTALPSTDPNITTSPHADSRQLIFAGNNILFACDGGIYECANPSGIGEAPSTNVPTWSCLNANIADTELYTATLDTYNGDLLGGAQDNGAFQIAGGTATEKLAGDGTVVAVDQIDHIQYYSFYNFNWGAIVDVSGNTAGGTYRTAGVLYNPNATVLTKAGGTPITGDLTNSLNEQNANSKGGTYYYFDSSLPFTTIYKLNEIDPKQILVGGGGTLYLSTDEGNTFYSIGGLNSNGAAPQPVRANPAFKTDGGSYATSTVTAIAFGASDNQDAAYVALSNGDIYYTPDVTTSGGGFTRTNFDIAAGGKSATDIVMDPKHSNIAYAVISGVGVYETTNGNTWTSITGNLTSLMPSIPSNQSDKESESVTLFNRVGFNSELLVGGLGGVFQLPINQYGVPSSGAAWSTYSGLNLPHVLVDDLHYYPQSDTLLAGTLGRGIWTVANASATIGQAQALQITGAGAGTNITLSVDPNNALNLLVTDGTGASQSIPFGSFQSIDVTTNGSNVIIGSQATSTPGTTSFLTVPLTISGSSGGQLTIQDAGSSAAAALTVTSTQVGAGTGDSLFGTGGSLTYSGMTAVNLDLGSGADTLTILSSAAGTPITANLGTGADTVSAGDSSSGTLRSAVTLNGQGGADTFDISPSALAVITVNGSPSPAANVLNFNAAPLGTPLAVYVQTGQYTTAGMQNFYFSNVPKVYLDNTAAVNTLYGPDTADRNILTGLTPQQRFVQVLYLNVLGRPGTASEVANWVSVLSSQGQAAVAAGIEGSLEARERLVNTWYETYLGRAADSSGLVYWSNLLSADTEEEVLAQILGGTEFFNRAQTLVSSGTPQERYVQALYQVLLNRTGSASELASWVSALPQLGDPGVAYDFLVSAEFRTNDFEAYYQTLLHRPSDSVGLNGWVNSTAELLQVRVAIESSAEFYRNG